MKKLISKIQKTIEEYELIDDGDKIAVGLSGGKDSNLCLIALSQIQKYYQKKFELVAITIDNYSGKQDYSKLQQFCEELGVEYHIVTTEIAEVVFNIRKEKNPCSLCAKMRRGKLCEKAKELHANKLVLGHHQDDIVNSFLMSLLYEGRLKTLKPKSYMSRSDITVIRPLYNVKENEIVSAMADYPTHKNICPIDHATARQKMYTVISQLETIIPNAYDKISSAIMNTDSADI